MAATIAHSVHYVVIGCGVVGLLWLLVPRHRADPRPDGCADDDRVAALRRSAVAGRLEADARHRAGAHETSPQRTAARAGVVVAAVAGLLAAVIHAAVCPEHVAEGLLLGGFFAVLAVVQVAWSQLALAAERRAGASQPLLATGLAGSLGVAALWLLTRTVGLPFGLLDGTESPGLPDVAATLLEITTALAAALVLHSAAHAHRRAGGPGATARLDGHTGATGQERRAA
ncbi:MAG: hypothetical protein ACTHMW_09680 [Actinomycetes bacterium]